MSYKSFTFGLLGIAAGAFMTGALQLVVAWAPPGQPAPGGNVDAPINVGGTTQVKEGSLTLNSTLLQSTGLSVGSNAYVGGKVFAGVSTVDADAGTTLVTKDYLDAKVAGGGGGNCYWVKIDSTSINFTSLTPSPVGQCRFTLPANSISGLSWTRDFKWYGNLFHNATGNWSCSVAAVCGGAENSWKNSDGTYAICNTGYTDSVEKSIEYLTCAGSSGGGDNLGNHTATMNINMAGSQITNLGNTVNPSDAATKAYVDGKVGGLESGSVNYCAYTDLCGKIQEIRYTGICFKYATYNIDLTMPDNLMFKNGGWQYAAPFGGQIIPCYGGVVPFKKT